MMLILCIVMVTGCLNGNGGRINEKGPIIDAILSEDMGEVEKAINENKNEINSEKDVGGLYPLHWAAGTKGSSKLIKLLIKNGANVDILSDDSSTPLSFAAAQNRLDCVKELIDSGGDVNFGGDLGLTPLVMASINGYTEIVKELIKRGADINLRLDDGTALISLAIRSNEIEVVKELVKSGADLSIADNEGKTPLDIAIKEGKDELVDYIKEEFKRGNNKLETNTFKPTKPPLSPKPKIAKKPPLPPKPELNKEKEFIQKVKEVKISKKIVTKQEKDVKKVLLNQTKEESEKENKEREEILSQIDIAIAANIENEEIKLKEEKSKIKNLKNKFASIYSKVKEKAEKVEEKISGPEAITSLIHMEEEVAKEKEEQVLKLNRAKFEKAQKSRIEEVKEEYEIKEKEIANNVNSTFSKVTNSPKMARKKELIESNAKMIVKLSELNEEYDKKIRMFENPMKVYLEDYHAWKQHTFYKYLELNLGNELMKYEAIGMGSVDRQKGFFERNITIAGGIATSFLPFGGDLMKKGVEKAIEIYYDREMKKKITRVVSLYNYGGVKGMYELSSKMAGLFVYKLREPIKELSVDNLEILAGLAIGQMVDYTINHWKRYERKVIEKEEFLLEATEHKPKWWSLKGLKKDLKTEEGKACDAWLLLSGEEYKVERTEVNKKSKELCKNIKKYSEALIDYMMEQAEDSVE